jgi:hypothetical protein
MLGFCVLCILGSNEYPGVVPGVQPMSSHLVTIANNTFVSVLLHDLDGVVVSPILGGPVGLSPPLFFILAGKSKFEERRKRGKNYQKTDGPRTDDNTISASTNKMKLVCFYSPAIRLQRQNI